MHSPKTLPIILFWPLNVTSNVQERQTVVSLIKININHDKGSLMFNTFPPTFRHKPYNGCGAKRTDNNRAVCTFFPQKQESKLD